MTTHDQNSGFFISQKFENCEDDKLEVYQGSLPLHQLDDYKHQGWMLISSAAAAAGAGVVRRIYTYKRVAPRNFVRFQLKPPVKSRFTNIPGPYKVV